MKAQTVYVASVLDTDSVLSCIGVFDNRKKAEDAVRSNFTKEELEDFYRNVYNIKEKEGVVLEFEEQGWITQTVGKIDKYFIK